MRMKGERVRAIRTALSYFHTVFVTRPYSFKQPYWKFLLNNDDVRSLFELSRSPFAVKSSRAEITLNYKSKSTDFFSLFSFLSPFPRDGKIRGILEARGEKGSEEASPSSARSVDRRPPSEISRLKSSVGTPGTKRKREGKNTITLVNENLYSPRIIEPGN